MEFADVTAGLRRSPMPSKTIDLYLSGVKALGQSAFIARVVAPA
jgi:hypothetical protein